MNTTSHRSRSSSSSSRSDQEKDKKSYHKSELLPNPAKQVSKFKDNSSRQEFEPPQ